MSLKKWMIISYNQFYLYRATQCGLLSAHIDLPAITCDVANIACQLTFV
jgi:hypothetical protein